MNANTQPTYEDLVKALGTLLCEYSVIDEVLDGFMAQHDATEEEREGQRCSNESRDAVQAIWERAMRAKVA